MTEATRNNPEEEALCLPTVKKAQGIVSFPTVFCNPALRGSPLDTAGLFSLCAH